MYLSMPRNSAPLTLAFRILEPLSYIKQLMHRLHETLVYQRLSRIIVLLPTSAAVPILLTQEQMYTIASGFTFADLNPQSTGCAHIIH